MAFSAALMWKWVAPGAQNALLPRKRAHPLPGACAGLILLLAEAGPGASSGAEGFEVVLSLPVPIKSVCLAHHPCSRSAPGLRQDSGLC